MNDRLVIVVNRFSLTVTRIIGPHLGWPVDEDAVVKLTETQVALRANVLMCLNGFTIPTHMVAVSSLPCMVSGFQGQHSYIHTKREWCYNYVPSAKA